MATYAGPIHAGPAHAGPDGAGTVEVGEPIEPGCIVIDVDAFAPHNTIHDSQAIHPGCIVIPINDYEVDGSTPGPLPVPDVVNIGPIRPGCIVIDVDAFAPWVIPAGNPNHPQAVEMPRLLVDGPGGSEYLTASCDPCINDVGTGSYSFNHYGRHDISVSIGQRVSFIANGPVFTGYVDGIVTVTNDAKEEEGWTTTVSVIGYADLLRKVIVFPMHGAKGGDDKPCAPIEESRVFDWTHVDRGVPGGVGRIEDPIKEALKEEHGKALPDPWPDPTSMWVNPGTQWSYGALLLPWRGPTVQVWGVAYDYLEVYIDGAKVIECKNAGQPEFATVTLWDESADTYGQTHWMAYRAFCSQNGGVMMTVMPPGLAGTYGDPIVNTGAGGFTFAKGQNAATWPCSEVIQRLAMEQAGRGAGPPGCPTLGAVGNIANDGQAITLQVGMTYLDVLNQLADSMIDWDCNFGGTVQCRRKGRGSGVGLGGLLPIHQETDITVRR